MPPALELALIVTLVVLLAVTSATSAVLWHRSRSLPWSEITRLANALGDCRRVLESSVDRTNAPNPANPQPEAVASRPGVPAPPRRMDRAGRRAPAGPTLIAVPDLTSGSAPTSAPAELGRRFGAVWELADRGASAEAIARTTGQPIGQVELILGLRRQLHASGGPP